MGLVQDLLNLKGVPDHLKTADKTPEKVAAKFDDGVRIIRLESQKQFFQEAFATGAQMLSNERAHAFDHYSMRIGDKRIALLEVDTVTRKVSIMGGEKLPEISEFDMEKINTFAGNMRMRLVLGEPVAKVDNTRSMSM